MKTTIDRRTFLRIAGTSLGAGALYRVGPAFAAGGEGGETRRRLAGANGEGITPFTFVQLSDAHVGFQGPPNPTGTAAFERAVEVVNKMPDAPDLILFTGDLTHDSEQQDERAARMRRFREISDRLRVKVKKSVPGEHDAGIDGGALYREFFGETRYAFDHKGVHFVALDNVSRAKPEVGAESIAWLKTEHEEAHVRHCAARSLIFAFPDPSQAQPKKPIPFEKERPFKNLGLRVAHAGRGAATSGRSIALDEVELTMRELSGTEGFQQFLGPSSL